MITQSELYDLLNLGGRPDSPILSIYVNVDQSTMSNLNRGFEVSLKNMLNHCESDLAEESKKAFREDVKKAMAFIANYTPQKTTLVLFCDASSGLLWERSVRVPMENRCFWERRPQLRPLIEAQNEYERYGLILTDRAHARLFSIALGEIEENTEAFAKGDVARYEASGSDHLLSQSTFQRSADEHAKWHLKHVADLMEHLYAEQHFDRLVLAGPKEAVAKLQDQLSSHLQKRVVGTIALPVNAKETEILEATECLVAQREREVEAKVVERLVTAAAKRQHAVIGLPSTVEAAVNGRIMSLVYTESFAEHSGEWQAGKKLYNQIQELSNGHTGAPVHSSGDLLEWLVVHVARHGGRVEHVRDGAAETLKKDAKGIGAFLRY